MANRLPPHCCSAVATGSLVVLSWRTDGPTDGRRTSSSVSVYSPACTSSLWSCRRSQRESSLA